MNLEIVTSCINCAAPGSVLATFALIVMGVGLVVRTELQKAKVYSVRSPASVNR